MRLSQLRRRGRTPLPLVHTGTRGVGIEHGVVILMRGLLRCRYAVLRAIDRDIESLHITKRLVDAANAELMQFDWKNGPLR